MRLEGRRRPRAHGLGADELGIPDPRRRQSRRSTGRLYAPRRAAGTSLRLPSLAAGIRPSASPSPSTCPGAKPTAATAPRLHDPGSRRRGCRRRVHRWSSRPAVRRAASRGADQRIVVSLEDLASPSPATGPHAARRSPSAATEIGRSRFYVARGPPRSCRVIELPPMAERRARALPDRRQLARLPGVLRPAGVDRDQRRAADQRDLRAGLDAGQDHRRAPAGRGRRRLGRGDVGARGHLRPLQGPAHTAARPAARAVAAPDAAGRGLRLHQRQGRGLRGRRRDRLAGAAGAGGGDPGDGRLRRPRRLPAGRRRGPGDEHLAGDHRDQGLRPRGRGRALRGAAGAGHRPDGAARRHLRQHPRRSGDRREDRDAAAAGVRLAGGGAGQRREDLRRQTQAEPGRARRGRPHLQAAGDAPVRHRDRGRPGRGDGRRARPRRPARLHARVRAAGGDGAARRGAARGRGGARPQRRDRARGRGGGGDARPTSAEGPVALAIAGERWAAADGERIVTGDSTPGRAGRRARPAGRSSPTTPSRSAAAATGCSPPRRARASSWSSTTTRWSPPTCWSRSAAPTS